MPNGGFRINESIDRPDWSLIGAFKDLPVANIGDSVNRAFCMASSIRPFNGNALLGPALTVKVRPGDNLLLHKALDMAKPGDIVVVDGQGETSNALIGGVGGRGARGKLLPMERMRACRAARVRS